MAQTNGNIVTPKTPAPPASVLSLAHAVRGKRTHPLWTHLYGPEGCGKSTFGAGAPDPIFIDVEHGSNELDITRFAFDAKGRTTPATWMELIDALRVLEKEKHEYRSVAIDTLDAAEALNWAFICERDSKTSIEDYGYGKGYVAAVDEWRIFVAALERLRARGLQVVTLAHSMVKPFKNPLGEDYDRFQMKLHTQAAGLVKERADAVLFAQYEELPHKDEKTKRVRGVSTGARVMFTVRKAAYDAKNRFDLPERMPLSWEDYWNGIQGRRPADPKALIEQIKTSAARLGGETEAYATKYVEQNSGDAAALAKLNDRLNAKLVERSEQEGN
jgi:hypothetical protein